MSFSNTDRGNGGGLLSSAALGAINYYQRKISPNKGYGCALRLEAGGTGCSGYAKHAIMEHGLIKAVPMIRQRFKDCKEAAETRRARRRSHGNEGACESCSDGKHSCQKSCGDRWRYGDDCCDRHCSRQCDNCAPSCSCGEAFFSAFGRSKRGASNCDCTPDCGDCSPF